ncbi:MAG: glycine--tRNA ligase subunit beta [Deltaproteobacteria bacterium]|nr:glycine--tRNA ligase subunit beta [Deltaproteobacteria bacterium]
MNELLFEIGCEEIPARVVPDVLAHMKERAVKLPESYGLDVSSVEVYGTPRRLALSVQGLSEATKRVKKELSGPPTRIAFDKDGKPTKAAEAFAKTAGLPVEKLTKKETPKGEYLVAEVEEGGESAAVVLERFLTELLTTLPLPKSMRWGAEEVKFSRPVQWLLAVLTTDKGTTTLPVKFGLLAAGAISRGHRFMAPDPFNAARRQDYLEKLRERFVIADPAERKKRVLDEARKAAKEAGGVLFYDPQGAFPPDPLAQQTYFDGLVDEVTFLCETPFGVFGTFAESALDLPREVVLAAMRNHQRYFGVSDERGTLKPAFVTIAASRVKDPALVRRGNERVLKARLSDATYFFVEDQKRALHGRTADLKTVTYHKKIGSSYEKVERVLKLSFVIAEALGEGMAPKPVLEDFLGKTPERHDFWLRLGRAVALSKADLTTLMVGEFPELQGIVGAHYAKGEDPEVITAVRDHYRPRAADDLPAQEKVAAIVAIADKLDTIVGIVAIGQMPSGSSDPFALRRSAIGVLRTLLQHEWRLDWTALVQKALDGFSIKKADDAVAKANAFLADRFLNYLLPEKPGPEADAVRAVVAAGVQRPVEAKWRVTAVQAFAKTPAFTDVAATLKRVINILKEDVTGDVDTALFAAPAEKDLHSATFALADLKRSTLKKPSQAAYEQVLSAVADLRPKVDAFFEAVMVMDKDAAVKANRLRLLRNVAALVRDVADFSKL